MQAIDITSYHDGIVARVGMVGRVGQAELAGSKGMGMPGVRGAFDFGVMAR